MINLGKNTTMDQLMPLDAKHLGGPYRFPKEVGCLVVVRTDGVLIGAFSDYLVFQRHKMDSLS